MFKTHCLSFVIKGIFTLCNICLRLEDITSPHSQTEILKVFRGAKNKKNFIYDVAVYSLQLIPSARSVLKEGW